MRILMSCGLNISRIFYRPIQAIYNTKSATLQKSEDLPRTVHSPIFLNRLRVCLQMNTYKR